MNNTAKSLTILSFIGIFSVVVYSSPHFCQKAHAVTICSGQNSISESTNVSQTLAPGYFTYSDKKLEELLDQNIQVVLYFHAPWCTSCSSFDLELREMPDALPNNTAVLQIPYDTATELKKKYNVTYQHTLILLHPNASTREMWIGGNLEALVKYLNSPR